MSVQLQVVEWNSLSQAERALTLRRPAQRSAAELHDSVRNIIQTVRSKGDAALIEMTRQHDGVALHSLEATASEFAIAEAALSREQHAALDRAIDNVARFH